ncbi:MAG TPA: CPBP family intramembrane glutamic endopeptidase, partial [Bdellovibrionales bacterium]|nr:CPBP family intramembrane glutamic endopeptidase [Bdellovibrionales bacterium]
AGNLLTSIVFGLLHALTPAYFIIATGISLYLGWVYEASGRLLAVPLLIHGLYDFAALLLYRRKLRQISPPLHDLEKPGAPF